MSNSEQDLSYEKYCNDFFKELNKAKFPDQKQVEDLIAMLKESHITMENFKFRLMSTDYKLDDWIDLCFDNTNPAGINWDTSRTELIDYKQILLDKSLNGEQTTRIEWYDQMWFQAEEHNDKDAIDFIWGLNYKGWKELSDSERVKFKEVCDRQNAQNQKHTTATQKRIKEVKELLAEFELLKERDDNIKAENYHKAKWEEHHNRIALLPPENCPPLTPAVDLNEGSLGFEAQTLVAEMDKGQHDWANNKKIELFKWARYKYRVYGKHYPAQRWIQALDNYNSRERKASKTTKKASSKKNIELTDIQKVQAENANRAKKNYERKLRRLKSKKN